MKQTCLNFTELPDGNLRIELTPEGSGELMGYIFSDGGTGEEGWVMTPDRIWSELIESYSSNGSYSMIRPEDIGALTEAPIIALNFGYDDVNERVVIDQETKIWWYPDYQVSDELKELLYSGFVLFLKAPGVS